MQIRKYSLAGLIFFSFGLSACDSGQAQTNASTDYTSKVETYLSDNGADDESVSGVKGNLQNENDNSTTEEMQAISEDLSQRNYEDAQTITINDNKPFFSEIDLSTDNGSWERYGDLDELNRATSADAMLNQNTMPDDNEDRGDISNVEPTGWKNKKIDGGYLYNRSHLIGWALSGENDNWKNLITGTRQLNSPEMVRFEMDVKTYLEQSEDNYVRYSVTPIFRGDELLPRGVHMMAQSVGDNEISFNKYIFNVQDGVRLDYSDGSSEVDESLKVSEDQESTENQENETTDQEENVQKNPSNKLYVDENGKGLIKGSNTGIYHVPDSPYYDRTTNPKEWFKTIKEAEQAGYKAPE